VGIQRTLAAALQQSRGSSFYDFVSWSDGGAATHVITTPAAPTTYLATYAAGTRPPPAPVTHSLLTAGNNTVNQKVYTTAAISPAPNSLVTVAVLGHRSTSPPPSATLSGGGMTAWTEVATTAFDGVVTPLKRLTIYRTMSAAPGSGPLTITFSANVSNCQWIVSQWSGVETSGVNGAGAIGQTGSSRGDAVSGLTVPLTAFANPNNVAYGVFGVRSPGLAVTPGAGFAELSEQPSAESPPSDLEAEWATNANTIAATWSALNAGALGVEIKAAGSGSASPGRGVDAAQSTVAAAPNSIEAGSGTATITVTVKDASGNPISGATVLLAATGGGNTLTQPGGPTDANGVATGILRSTAAGTKTISAMANGTALTQTAQVTVTPGPVSASASTVTAAPGSITAGSGTSTITVTVKDANGNPISDASVVLTATGSGSTLTQPAGPTNASGVATGTLSSTVAGTETVSATANGTALTQTATITVTTQVPATITHTLLTAGNNTANQKVYTTAAISPAPNTLIMVAVLGHRATTGVSPPIGAPPSPTLSGGGMTAWTEVATITFDTVATPQKRLTIYRAMSATPGSGALTITWSNNVSNCQWIVSQWDEVETSGVNGAGAIGQTGSSRGDAVSGLTVPLTAFGNADNVAYGVFGVASSTPAITPGAGFTEISEQPSGESAAGDLQAEWALNGNPIAATWSTLNAGALGVEIRTRTAGP
jgi:protocatechuate 3,4-dioxygenase beta subunit